MVTVGGDISGYCAIGRLKPAMTPASVMMIAMTLAKIGLSMKKRAKLPMALLRVRLRRPLRLDRGPRANLDEVVHDDGVAFAKARGHHGVRADPAGGLHRLRHDLAVGADRHHHARLVVLQDGLLGNEDRGLLTREHAHLRELAGQPA